MEVTKGSFNLDNGIPPRIATYYLIFFSARPVMSPLRFPLLVGGVPSDL